MSTFTKRDLRLLHTILSDHIVSGPPEEKVATQRMAKKVAALLLLKTKKDYWMTYDYQTGQWLVQKSRFAVLRPDSVVIHAREVQ